METDIAFGLLSSAGGGGLVACVAYFLFHRLIERMDILAAELATIRDERLAAVEEHVKEDTSAVAEKRLEAVEHAISGHLEKDESQRITTELKVLVGEVRRMADQLTASLAANEGQKADLANCKNWLKDVAGEVVRHRENQSIHGGKP